MKTVEVIERTGKLYTAKIIQLPGDTITWYGFLTDDKGRIYEARIGSNPQAVLNQTIQRAAHIRVNTPYLLMHMDYDGGAYYLSSFEGAVCTKLALFKTNSVLDIRKHMHRAIAQII